MNSWTTLKDLTVPPIVHCLDEKQPEVLFLNLWIEHLHSKWIGSAAELPLKIPVSSAATKKKNIPNHILCAHHLKV